MEAVLKIDSIDCSNRYWLFLPLLFVFSPGSGLSQVLLDPTLRLPQQDMAVLESGEFRSDLPCKVVTEKPVFRFDLRFHANYTVMIPLKDLPRGGERMYAQMRITPIADELNAVRMIDRLNVPPIPDNAKGVGSIAAGFAVGPGRYRVDWLMRERQGRYCSSHWHTDAKLAGSERDLPLGLAPNTVAPLAEVADPGQPECAGNGRNPLHVKILLNVAPSNAARTRLDSEELEVLGSLLQNIGRELKSGSFTLVAFNPHTQKIVHRQESVRRVDTRALDAAIANSKAGTIDYRSLLNLPYESKFLSRILTDEIVSPVPRPDLVIIAGPKVSIEGKVSLDRFTDGEAPFPIFYFSHVANPIQDPFRDPIGTALKAYKSTSEHKIMQPRDMGVAILHLLSWVRTRGSTSEQITTSGNTRSIPRAKSDDDTRFNPAGS